MKNKEEFSIDAFQVQDGDVLHCSSNGIIGRAIKKFTKSKLNHTALVIQIWDKLFVIDAQANGVNLKTFEDWVKVYKYKYKVSRPKVWNKEMKIKAISKVGITGYDFASLLVYQPLYLLTGKWYGKKKHADSKMYCSEYVSWVFNLPEWYANSPQDVYDKMVASNDFTEVKIK